MGKQVQKRHRRRVNPIGNRVAAGVQQGATAAPEQVLPVIEKLSSPEPNERAWAAACVSNLIMAGESVRRLLLSKGVVKLLLERLTDDQSEVLEESLGALRNLVAVDPTVAHDYYKRDILTPLMALVPKISNTIDRIIKNVPVSDETDKDQRRTVWDVAENVISIIWSICEASDKYIKAVNRLNIVTFLVSFLSAADQCPTRVVVAAGQCLTTLTEDNKDIYIEFQNHPEYSQMLFDVLRKFQTPETILVRVLACAILMNVREVIQMAESWDDKQDGSSELNKTVLPILVSALEYDIQEAAEKTLAAVRSGNVHKHEETGEITPKPKQPLTAEEIYIQSVEERLSALQLALELLADICIQDDSDEDGWEDADEDMGDDEDGDADSLAEDNIEEYLRDAAAVNDSVAAAAEDEAIRANPILRSFVFQVSPHLVRLATLTPLSFPSEPLAPTVTEAIRLTHQRALECFNNFLLAMNEIPSKFWFQENKSDACQAWRWLFDMANTVGSTPASEGRDDILEIIVGCLWSLGRGLGQDIPVEPSDVQSLIGAYQTMALENMRVKIIGCLGCIAMRQGAIETNKEIGLFFMKVLQDIPTRATTPDVAVETLNALYDVYSDCAFDYDEPVFVQGGFLAQLRQIQPAYRAMVKSIDRRKYFDLRSRSDEAYANLVAFIKYKATERRN